MYDNQGHESKDFFEKAVLNTPFLHAKENVPVACNFISQRNIISKLSVANG